MPAGIDDAIEQQRERACNQRVKFIRGIEELGEVLHVRPYQNPTSTVRQDRTPALSTRHNDQNDVNASVVAAQFALYSRAFHPVNLSQRESQ
jgi:hypothetical protein